ncbi:NucA/NucB deoxyribonuclease domain-containing protein [Micromonospora sp. NPDC003776]
MSGKHGGSVRRASRRLLTAAVVLATFTTSFATSTVFGQPAAHAAEAAADTVPPAAVNSGGTLLQQGYKGDADALSKVQFPKGRAKSAPEPVEQAEKEAHESAVANDARTFLDASEADKLAAEASAAATAPATAPNALEVAATPPAPGTAECLGRDGAHSENGTWLNRFLWCQRYGIGVSLYQMDPNLNIPVYLGKITMQFQAVVEGRKDDRSVRVYFHSVPGSVVYDLPAAEKEIAPSMLFTMSVGCSDSACSSFGLPVPQTWSLWNDTDLWWWWDVSSDETASTNPDKVLYHKWYFTFEGAGGGYVFDGPARTPERTIRCDSANYFELFGVDYPKACINAEVIPHLQYTVGDPGHDAVARHIQTAQDSPLSTYPIELDETKSIPGKYTGNADDRGLHRVPYQGAIYNLNVDMKNAACGRQYPYNDWTGLPPYDTSTSDCDEYPFATTAEGAATRNFSVRAVPSSQNRSAGSSLRYYYFGDRILYNYQDQFWVEIKDCLTCGGGGGGTVVDEPPSVAAGPDYTGDEGAFVNLYGVASDDGGAPSISWSYTAGSDVDAGTTCTFGDVHSARTRFTCDDDGTFTVTLTASDGVNPAVSDSANVTLANLPPRITGVSPPNWQVYKVNTVVPLNVTFTDAPHDTHTCSTTWDDGTRTSGPAQNHACTASNVYLHPGMYTIKTVVTDDDGASVEAKTMVVVYDPQGGFATSGAYYNSPTGAYAADRQAGGRTRLEMNPQYQHNEPGPSLTGGRVAATFDSGAFSLQSTSLDWLVAAPDGKIAVKGKGTVNGTAGYGFVIYGYQDPAKVRIVVWDLANGPNPTGAVTYDNRGGIDFDLDLADPQDLDGGSLQVHL